MTFTSAGTANPSSNVSRKSKHSILLKSYTRAFAATIPVHVPWPLEYLESGTSGRPQKQTVRTMSESANHAKNMATSSTRSRNKMGNGYPWSLLTCQGTSEISDYSRRLLHQMDRSQTINHYHGPTGSTVCLEGHCMQIWRPTHHHYRKWPIIYR